MNEIYEYNIFKRKLEIDLDLDRQEHAVRDCRQAKLMRSKRAYNNTNATLNDLSY